MKRMLTLTLILTLVLALAMPAAAFAKRGGVPANGKDNGRGAIRSGEVDADEPSDKPGKDKDGKKDKSDADDLVEGVELEVEGEEAVEGDEVVEAEEKLTGIANALSRLQRNLARKQAAFDAGTAKGLPAGLQATIAKFMSWLGIDPAAEAEDIDEGSDETSGTVEPELVDELDDEDADSETPEAPVDE